MSSQDNNAPGFLPSIFDEWYELRNAAGACKVCQEHNRMIYEPATEPGLPHEGCTCIGGCKCHYVKVPYPPKY